MNIDPLNDAKIVDSWRKNASPWTAAVREGQIESRRLSTDGAIVDAILDSSPHSVIDIGCGEGWLSRVLVERGIKVLGIDVVPELISEAQRAGGGDYRVASYEEVIAGNLEASADVVVCNFSLLGKDCVEGLLRAVPTLLNSQGSCIVQTLHPMSSCGDSPYQDGWREGSWDGFSTDFSDPAPWYFRTTESWKMLFKESGFRIREVREPTYPEKGEPVSTIFIAEVGG
ncbi:MAG: class I SAM-dependent methyltransferase [Aeoliella sp.]